MPTRLTIALQRIRDARSMTERMLEGLQPSDWFWQPADGMNPIAWHVGHMAFAEYFLCLKRLRGRIPEDESLVTTHFLKKYKQGSRPNADPGENYEPDAILRILAGIHEQAMRELGEQTDATLEVPSQPPHPVFTTKLGAIEWCSQHEMMHNGQITLLRRLMGKPPRW